MATYQQIDAGFSQEQLYLMALMAINSLPRQPCEDDLISIYATSNAKNQSVESSRKICEEVECFGGFARRGKGQDPTIMRHDRSTLDDGKFDGLNVRNYLMIVTDVMAEGGGSGKYGLEGTLQLVAQESGLKPVNLLQIGARGRAGGADITDRFCMTGILIIEGGAKKVLSGEWYVS